jgi:hypothetical protein
LSCPKIRPAVEYPRQEIRHDQELDLDLEDPSARVARLDAHDSQLVVKKLPLVVRVQDFDLHHRTGQIRPQHGVQKVDRLICRDLRQINKKELRRIV